MTTKHKKKSIHIRIVQKRNLWFTLSFIIIAIGFSLMAIRAFQHKPALNYGVDFIGGTTMSLQIDSLRHAVAENPTAIKKVHTDFIATLRSKLSQFGLENSRIQITDDHTVMIKTSILSRETSTQVQDHLQNQLGPITPLEIDFIGPSIGSELRSTAILIFCLVSAILLLYITWRFQFAFGVAALAALIHDALVIISFASILSIEINTAFIAAILTILGYSINDTIVIFDRIRENIPLLNQGESLTDVANFSLQQTLIRTAHTSITTLLVLISLFIFGGNTIHDFCTVLLIGVIAGTYSSLFIAAPVLMLFRNKITSTESN